MAECSKLLHLSGLASPRTCALCGLGPCHKADQVTKLKTAQPSCNESEGLCPVHEAIATAIETAITCHMCAHAPNGVCELHNTNDHIQPEDSEATFADKFAKSLEDQADAMEAAIESFVDYPNVRGGLMATRGWLRKTALAIRDEIG